ncbi:hypothetical protein NUK31_22650 [Aeromonas caviae]|nr:hypothetical protein [Aeromonas caviae]
MFNPIGISYSSPQITMQSTSLAEVMAGPAAVKLLLIADSARDTLLATPPFAAVATQIGGTAEFGKNRTLS